MADADSVLGSISLDEIIDLGNAWIQLGDEIHERRVAVNGHLGGLGMTGTAGDAAHRAWDEALGKTIDDAAETAWTVGQTIHRYAEELRKAADEYAKKINASMWATILGAIVGMAFLALGPLLGNLLSMIGSLLGRLIPVLSQMAARLGTLGTTAAGAVGGAVSGAALSLGIDVAVGAAGAAIAGTDYEVDWGAEAWSMGLGGLLGGVLGGFAGYHYTPRPASPAAGPEGGVPTNTSRGGPTISVNAKPEQIGGHDGPLGATPGEKFPVNPLKSGGESASAGPRPLGGFEGKLGGTPGEKFPVNLPKSGSESASAGPRPLEGHQGKLGGTPGQKFPVNPPKSGSESASAGPRPLEGHQGKLGGTPGQKFPVNPPVPSRTKSPASGNSERVNESPGARGYDFPATVANRPPSQTGDSATSNAPASPHPFERPGGKLGGPPNDPNRSMQPRPDGGNRPGEGTAGAAKPPTRSGVGHDRPATLGDVADGTHGGGGRGAGQGGGTLRANEGSSTQIETQPPASRPGPGEGTRTVGDDVPSSSAGAAGPVESSVSKSGQGTTDQGSAGSTSSGSAGTGGVPGGTGAGRPVPVEPGHAGGGSRGGDAEGTGGAGAHGSNSSALKGGGASADELRSMSSGSGVGRADEAGGSGPGGKSGQLEGGGVQESGRGPGNELGADPAKLGTGNSSGKGSDQAKSSSQPVGSAAGESGRPNTTRSGRGHNFPATNDNRPPGSGATPNTAGPSPFAYDGQRLGVSPEDPHGSMQPRPARADRPGDRGPKLPTRMGPGYDRPATLGDVTDGTHGGGRGAGGGGVNLRTNEGSSTYVETQPPGARPEAGARTVGDDGPSSSADAARPAETSASKTAQDTPDSGPAGLTSPDPAGTAGEHGGTSGAHPAPERLSGPEPSSAAATTVADDAASAVAPAVSSDLAGTEVGHGRTGGAHPAPAQLSRPEPSATTATAGDDIASAVAPAVRHPGEARFDIDAARTRLDDPSVPRDRGDTSLQWATDAVLAWIGRVAPGENPLGVVPRVSEVVELVAAEHLRGGHLPATALLGSLVPVSPEPHVAPPSAPESGSARPNQVGAVPDSGSAVGGRTLGVGPAPQGTRGKVSNPGPSVGGWQGESPDVTDPLAGYDRPATLGDIPSGTTGGGHGAGESGGNLPADEGSSTQIETQPPASRPEAGDGTVGDDGLLSSSGAANPAETSVSQTVQDAPDSGLTGPTSTDPAGTEAEHGSGSRPAPAQLTRPEPSAPVTVTDDTASADARAVRHPGEARFDIDAARTRLDAPSVPQDRRDTSLQWAAGAVLAWIGRVAPGENPLGVVPRVGEVVELVAAEHLRGGHLPATALLGSLVQGARPLVPPPPAEEAPLPASPRPRLAPPPGQPDLDPFRGLAVSRAPGPRPGQAHPVRDWEVLSAVPKSRSKQVRAIDEAVRQLGPDPGRHDLQRVLDAIEEWKGGKSTTSKRRPAVVQLENAVRAWLGRVEAEVRDRLGQRDQRNRQRPFAQAGSAPAGSAAEGQAGATLSESAEPDPVEVEGYAPASGFEGELHKFQVAGLDAEDDAASYGHIVELPGLLYITLDKVGNAPVLEVVSVPARGLVRGRPDGRAERSEVIAAFLDVLKRLAEAPHGASLSRIFPASAGFKVVVDAANLRVRGDGQGTILVHHTATAPLSGVIQFLEHVREHMRVESLPVQIAKQDLQGGVAFGRAAVPRFQQWLAAHQDPALAAQVRAWDEGELAGALALGYTQVAAAARDTKSARPRGKDFTAAASRDSLQAIRATLGAVPRRFLTEESDWLAGEFERPLAEAMQVDSVLTRRMPRHDAGVTIRHYLENLLLDNPQHVISQYHGLRIRTDFNTLDSNPDAQGTARINPPVVRLETRPYAPIESTPATIIEEYETLAQLSLDLYNEARRQHGLRPVGGPVAQAAPTAAGTQSGQPLAAPPTHTTVLEAQTAQAPPTTGTPAHDALPAPLADLATRLPGMTAEERTRELTLLPSGQLEALAADPALITDLRRQLPPADFAATAAQLLVRVPEGVEQPVSARSEAQGLVAGMLADPEVAGRLLAGGTRLFVVPRDAPLTSLGPFAELHGASADGRSFATLRGIHHNGQVAASEENLLGEATRVPGDGVYPDGYSTVTHELAHAIHESGLSPAERAVIESAYQARVAEGEAAHWPDGPLRDPAGVRTGANYSSHDAYEYFAQLSNAYLGTNTGTDPYTGAPRNNGPDWVRRHEPGLLPLLEQLYGPRQKGDGPAANPITAVQAENETWAGFRALWNQAEQELHPQPHAPVPPVGAPQDGGPVTHSAPVAAGTPSGQPLLAPPTSTTTMLEEPATQSPTDEAPAPATAPTRPTTTTTPEQPVTQAPFTHAPVTAQLAQRGLSPVLVPAGGDALAHALIAVAPKESGQLVGQSRPATPAELRAEIADAVAADLRRVPAARTLLSQETVPDGPDGASRLPETADEGSADATVRGLRTGNGPDSLDWLALGVAAGGLGVRITVLTPDRAPWTVGPADGRSVVLVQQERPGPHTGRWAATEPVAAAEQAQRPGAERAGETSGFTWGSTSSAAARPTASGPARPAVFFDADPRPTKQTTDESATAAHDPGEGSSRGPTAGGSGAGSGGSGSGQAPLPQSGDGDVPAPRTLSPYVRDYGSRHDGLVGLVPHEPVPEDVLAELHQQVLTTLGVPPGSAAETEVRRQLGEELSAAQIGLYLPYVRSTRGHRVTVTVDGTQRTVDVRLRLTDPRLATRGTQGEVPRATKLERQSEGSQTSSMAESSGTMRTIPIPWTAIYHGPAGPLRWFDGALTLTLTHNQLTQSATVSEGVMTTSMQRANDQAHAVEFTGRWQVWVDAFRNAPGDTWGVEQSHGPLTAWFSEYRAFDHGGALGPFPGPAGLDDLPLWGVEAVAEPGRLLDSLLHDPVFAALRSLNETSRDELEDFLSEGMLRNTFPMQRDRGVYSPLLLDSGGNAIGMLQLSATVRPGSANAQTPHGQFRLESWVTHTSGVDRSARLTSGVGLDGSGGPMFTPDHAKGHPNAARRTNGLLFGKAGVSWQSSDALNTSNKASMMHALYTDSSHLHVPSDVTYRITLVRAGGGEISGSYGPWPEGIQLRLLPRGIGHTPTPKERRGLPGHLEHLESIGFSAVPIAVHGAERMFDRAEEWLRREGFLPPSEHSGFEWNEGRAQAQLANLRRFEQLRSRLGLAAALPDAVEGGRPVWFEQPGLVSGSRRVQLRFTAARNRDPRPGEVGTPPATHTLRLPDVQTAGNTSHEARGTRQRGNQFGGTLGGGGGPRWVLADGGWALDTTGEYVWGAQHSSSASVGSSQGGDQYTITTSGGTELFAVPARFALNLHEGSAEDPLVRFADPASDPASGPAASPQPAPVGPLGLRVPAPAAPATVAGHVTLAVPHHRTVPAQGRILPAPALDDIRAPRTGGGAEDDFVRLRLTDPAGAPQPGLIRLPDDVIVDVFRAGAALKEAFRQLVTGTYPGRPAAGALSRGLHTFSSRVPDVVTAPGAWLGEYLAGPAAGDQSAFAGEVLNQHLRVSNLLARAQQIFSGAYVIEGLVLPGLGADQELSLEIAGFLHNATHSDSFRSTGKRDLNATDTSSRQRTVATSHQFGGGVTPLQAVPTRPAGSPPPRVSQANPSVRVSGSRRTETTIEHSASTSAVRVPQDAADQYLITSDATLLVTLRQGTRNFFGNLVGLGSRDGITVAVHLPRAVQFTLSPSHLARYARWFAGVPGLPRLELPAPTLPPPDHFVRTGEIGTGSVLSVSQLGDPVRRNEVRDRLREELVAQVERVAPGVTRPGHSAYLPGVATRLADLTAPPALRALPARGRVRLWFRYAATGGARLIEVTLSARPQAGAPARGALLGRPAGEKTSVETVNIHAPENSSESRGITRTLQVTAAPISRYPRPGGGPGRMDRTGPVLTASTSRSSSVRSDFSADDRQWTKTGNSADFDDIVYDITGTVRSELIWDWPPDLLGGVLDQGWVSLTERGGGGLGERLARMIRGPRRPQISVPALVSVRFVGSEAVAPRPHDPPVRPSTSHTDPRRSPAPLSDGGPPFTAGPALVPTGPAPVTGFNGFPELAQALLTVAPDTAGTWGLSADAPPEAAAARLGELMQAGQITVGLSGTAAGLTTTMPGAWPVGSDPDETPTLQVTLHNPRPVTDAEDVSVERLRKPVRSTSSSSVVGSSLGLGYQSTLSGNRSSLHVVAFTVPLLSRQPVTRTGGNADSAGQRDAIKTGNPTRSATGANTRSHEILVDAVITVTGPAGTRYVTGSASVRLFDRELLGHGVIGPRVAPRVYDLPSMLAGQPSDPLRNWSTHPVTELPQVLVGELDGQDRSAQLWLDLGPDPDGSRLARALYVGSRTAVAANRPVELVVRGGTGLRFWPFTADGRLADLTPATTPTWNLLRTAVVNATDAADAEADAAGREAELGPQEVRAAGELAMARASLTAATAAHDTAAEALTAARTDRQYIAVRLGDAERVQAEAEGAADRRDEAVTTAEERLAQAEQALRRAREEAARNQPTATGAAGTAAPQAGPGPEAVSAAESARDAARSEWDAARGAADVAREVAQRASGAVARLQEQLAAAGERVSTALDEEQAAAKAVTRAEASQDERYEEHGRLRRELESVRQEQADQRELWENAWAQMPGLAAMLAADRCREMIGGARFPLGSLGKAPGGSGR
ncbi:hypothetical protein [Streptomyces sp. NBC_00829]|uniref:hypothetical protein n=1 Tax=Streptomyces sp. NBC_00829 TaxID=2903679 RepID=UPI00386A3C81|nr:hypothetical protein OG293_35815 [Streptomyces sp. NBC_00829]